MGTILLMGQGLHLVHCSCSNANIMLLRSFKLAKKPPNNGKKFYGCPFWKTSGCGFFIWEQEVQSMMQFQQAIDNEYEDLKAEQVRMKDKVAKLKAKKKKIEDEVDKLKGKLLEMKFQVSVAAKKEKHAMRALMWTWIIVGIAGFFWALGKTN